jgi:uncharacterized membrane protein YraQ (UPF0718 family)
MGALLFALRLMLELVPLFLVVSTLVYMAVERLTPERIQAVLGRGSSFVGVPLAAVFGAVTPFCSCTSVPIVLGMERAGIANATIVSFLIASPLVNPVAIALIWSAIGMWYAVLYTSAAIGIALVGATLIGITTRPPVPKEGMAASTDCSPCRPEPANLGLIQSAQWSARFKRAVRLSLQDLKKLWIPLTVAIVIGAVVHDRVPDSILEGLAGPDTLWSVPAAAILGVPVYASILVLLPLGSALLAKGVGVGVVTAFLMGASGFSLPEGIMLSKILPLPLLAKILGVFTAGVIAIGFIFQAVSPPLTERVVLRDIEKTSHGYVSVKHNDGGDGQ